MPTKRLRQFKFYFKEGEHVTIDLEPEDRYEILKDAIVIAGSRPVVGGAAKNLKFTYTYNLDDISMRKFTTWDEEIKPPSVKEEENPVPEDFPFR